MILKNRTCRLAASIAATLILLIYAAPESKTSGISFSGISSAIDSFNNTLNDMKIFVEDTKKTVNSISIFFKKIGSFIDLIGSSTLLLFISVIFLSSGFSSIGVPKGIAAFLLSLLTADAVWILWEMSFSRGAAEILPGLIKSNLIIFAPLLSIWIIRYFWPKGVSLIKRIIYSKRYPAIPKSTMLEISANMLNDWAEFQKNLTKDMLLASGKDDIIISPETSEKIKSIIKNLDNLSMKG